MTDDSTPMLPFILSFAEPLPVVAPEGHQSQTRHTFVHRETTDDD